MGVRTGQEYIDRLAASSPTIEIGGERVTSNIPEHPAFRNVVNTYAQLYDLQHSEPEVLTYESPTSGEPVGTSFLVPRTHEDLVTRRSGFKRWADHSLGTLGRTGDYLNSALMALSEAQGYFAQADPAFGENARRYYEKVREEDLLTTHTLIPPQANRSVGAAQQVDGRTLGAHVVSEDDNGIVIRGARMLATIGPTADELLVFPSTVLQGHARGRSVLLRVRDQLRRARAALRLPRGHGLRPLALRPPARVALRGDGRARRLRRRPRAVGARLHARAPAALQHVLRRHVRRRPHDPPGRDAHDGQDRGDPRAHLAHDRGDRHREVPARPGGRRGDDRGARGPQGPGARRRGRRDAQRVRRDDAGVGPAERRAQLVPEGLPAIPRDPAQAGRQRPDDAADRGRHRGPRRRRHRGLPAVRRPLGPGARAPVPPGVGPVDLRVRRPSDALRVLLLRRPGPHGGRARRLLRPRALQGAHQRVPAPRGRRGPSASLAGFAPRLQAVSRWRPRSRLRPPSPADRRRRRRAGSATPR